MTDHDRYSQGYRELRALVEALLQLPPTADPARLRAVLQEHRPIRCRTGGELLDRRLRKERQEGCTTCLAPDRTQHERETR